MLKLNNFTKTLPTSHKNHLRMSSKRSASTTTEETTPKKQKRPGHWSLGLLDSMENPENVMDTYTDDLVVTIKDKYPKAEFHYLVLPKEDISSLKMVTKKHEELLKHMHEVGEKLAQNEQHKGRNFKLGYHAEASMFRLHLHVISDDMNSSSLKTKKHWNSFTTDFFLQSKDILKQMRDEGKVILPSNETCRQLQNSPLKCHKCDYSPKNMPDLKHHIITHIK